MVVGILWRWNGRSVLSLLVSRMFPRWNVVVCDTMANVWALMGLPLVTGSTPHTTPGGDQEMKTSRQKRPRMCQLDFLWVFPTKIWFYVHCGPAGERVTESVVCGWSVGRQAGCDHVRPGVSVLYWPAQPPAGLPALSIAILQPDSSAYSPSAWSLALLSFRENKLSNVPWAER